MQNLTSDLWYKLCKKKEDAILAGKMFFLGISKIDSPNKKIDDAIEVKDGSNEMMKIMYRKLNVSRYI